MESERSRLRPLSLFAPGSQLISAEITVASHVRIFDTTLRDGEQSPGFSMTSEQKLEFAKQLERLNVDVIEAGFPAASPDDFAAVQQIAREIKGRIVTGLARCVPEDIDTLWEAVKVA